ncbi:response regulator [Persicimonas caeni]|uniref:histidine kinase n=1 Tax=Persicimonas caeni TaxID=2292766 RepID=A0A4Y6Q2D2_PERCE|nr:response regulator [Persicimonas caeni]QDG54713.1 response regulator [Persicimonas caeni]QED35934.1 response regulator [Persicimonas caeni]
MTINHNNDLHTRLSELEAENARLREALQLYGGTSLPEGVRDRELEALERAKQEADAANRSKSEFLANMSHEIRTPMTAILGYADVLLSHLDDPDNRHCVETIKRNGNFLLEIINDILDLSKIEAGKLEIDTTRAAPDELVAEVSSLMHVRAQEKQIPLVVEYDGDLPETIETDPTRLRQVLVNLVGNAIKFTDDGHVVLKVDFIDEAQSQIRFRVIDTGIGISETHQRRLFEPFAQADTSVTREFGGTGLGLTICRRLVERLGGRLEVDSTLGEGSTFTVIMPTGSLENVAMVTPRKGITMPEPQSARPLPKLECRVLVVDDRHEIRFLARYFIERAGGVVRTCANGKEAITCVAQAEKAGNPFDAVVMDMQMPVMDGYEASRRLRQEGYEGTIVALTANAMRGDRKKCLEAGCNGYVRKPIDGPCLVELLAEHISDETSSDEQSCAQPLVEPEVMVQEKGGQTSDTGKRILLVDDSKDLGEALAMLLKMRGHQVCVRLDGKSALEAAPDFEPDIVLLDLGLPDLDGYTVLKELKKLENLAETRFLAVSGRSGQAVSQRSIAEGFDHHVVKPVSAETLTSLIQH